ncbi:MAG: energy transducer TonB [Methylocystaceae bacterium]|nr:energy transducer TonB [Methylocystaceae bacterium]
MSVDIIMASPDPGGSDGLQQQMIQREAPVENVPPKDVVTPSEDVVVDITEERHTEADLIYNTPVSKLADVVLQRKPAPPVRAKKPVKKETPSNKPVVKNKKQIQTALQNVKGQEHGQTTQGAKQAAGIQQAGLAGEIKSAHYVLGSANNPKPKYPKLARKRGWQGRVVLSVHINKDGHPVQIEIRKSSGHKVLDRAALKALKKWTFQPALKGGIRIPSHINIPIRFDLMNS